MYLQNCLKLRLLLWTFPVSCIWVNVSHSRHTRGHSTPGAVIVPHALQPCFHHLIGCQSLLSSAPDIFLCDDTILIIWSVLFFPELSCVPTHSWNPWLWFLKSIGPLNQCPSLPSCSAVFPESQQLLCLLKVWLLLSPMPSDPGLWVGLRSDFLSIPHH